jgi:hypothetical protein
MKVCAKNFITDSFNSSINLLSSALKNLAQRINNVMTKGNGNAEILWTIQTLMEDTSRIFFHVEKIKSDQKDSGDIHMTLEVAPSEHAFKLQDMPIIFNFDRLPAVSRASQPPIQSKSTEELECLEKRKKNRLEVIKRMINGSVGWPKCWLEIKPLASDSNKLCSKIFVCSTPHVVHVLDGPQVEVISKGSSK